MENDIIAKDIIKIKESIKVDGVTEFSFVFPDNDPNYTHQVKDLKYIFVGVSCLLYSCDQASSAIKLIDSKKQELW